MTIIVLRLHTRSCLALDLVRSFLLLPTNLPSACLRWVHSGKDVGYISGIFLIIIRVRKSRFITHITESARDSSTALTHLKSSGTAWRNVVQSLGRG